MSSEILTLPSETVRSVMNDIFERMDVPNRERKVVVDTLMEASLSGYHSHGIMRVSMYVDGIRQGHMIPGAEMTVLEETVAAVHLDARYGMGPVTATEAIQRAVNKASETGVGCASVVHANDVARLGSYMHAPARSGFLVMLMINDAGGNPAVAPWGGVEAFLSTNPLAAGIPWREACPIVIDMSTSVAAGGKLKTLLAQGRDAPDGWLIDRHGKPATEVHPAVAMPPEHALLPLGGLVAGHKGFALSILVDVFAGALSGAGCSAGIIDDTERNGLFALAVDPDKFVGRETFNTLVDQYVSNIKQVKKMPEVEDILMPGERASRERQRRQAEGIPVERAIWVKVEEILSDFGITPPQPPVPGP